jgi:hypothetical protein
MRNLSLGQGIFAAIKADTLSLTAWQIGMYGFMALWLYGFRLFFHISQSDRYGAQNKLRRVLVHDADCDALWVRDLIPRELVADKVGYQREDVALLKIRASKRRRNGAVLSSKGACHPGY